MLYNPEINPYDAGGRDILCRQLVDIQREFLDDQTNFTDFERVRGKNRLSESRMINVFLLLEPFAEYGEPIVSAKDYYINLSVVLKEFGACSYVDKAFVIDLLHCGVEIIDDPQEKFWFRMSV